MMIVYILTSVTREVVLMHVDYPNVEPTPNAKRVNILHNVYVYLGIQEIPALHVFYVSK